MSFLPQRFLDQYVRDMLAVYNDPYRRAQVMSIIQNAHGSDALTEVMAQVRIHRNRDGGQ